MPPEGKSLYVAGTRMSQAELKEFILGCTINAKAVKSLIEQMLDSDGFKLKLKALIQECLNEETPDE